MRDGLLVEPVHGLDRKSPHHSAAVLQEGHIPLSLFEFCGCTAYTLKLDQGLIFIPGLRRGPRRRLFQDAFAAGCYVEILVSLGSQAES